MREGARKPKIFFANEAARAHIRRRMDIISIIIFIVIGAIAGWLAGLIMKGAGFGILGNIIVGVVGAFLAGWLFSRFFGVIGGNAYLSFGIYGVIGAVILLFIIGLFKKAKS